MGENILETLFDLLNSKIAEEQKHSLSKILITFENNSIKIFTKTNDVKIEIEQNGNSIVAKFNGNNKPLKLPSNNIKSVCNKIISWITNMEILWY